MLFLLVFLPANVNLHEIYCPTSQLENVIAQLSCKFILKNFSYIAMSLSRQDYFIVEQVIKTLLI
jgi:hypothetical protein